MSEITTDDSDLRELMREPAYRDSSHPNHGALRAEVTEGFQRRYGDAQDDATPTGDVEEVAEDARRGNPWKDRSNVLFRERLAEEEKSADKPEDSYRERNRGNGALGRTQSL